MKPWGIWIIFAGLTLWGSTFTDASLVCDFEQPCDSLQVDGRWGVSTGGRFVPNSYSPREDSTLHTSDGHFLYIASYSSASGRIQTPVFDFQNEAQCLGFSFIMNGPERTDRIGNMKVWLAMGQGEKVKQYWKDIIGNYGSAWQYAHIPLPRGRYYINLEAYLIDYNDDRIIAIDDFNVSSCAIDNEEPSTVEPHLQDRTNVDLIACDFENSHMCGYSNHRSDKFKWLRVTAGDADVLPLPHRDHTYGGLDGHYVYTVAPPTEGAAKLVSRTFHVPSEGPYCLDFYYNLTLKETSARFFVYNISESDVMVLWNSDDVNSPSWAPGAGGGWRWAALPLYPGRCTLVFELRSYSLEWLDATAFLALDDITVTRCDLMRNVPSAPPSRDHSGASTAFPIGYSCDFEDGATCGAQNERLFAHSWEVEEDGHTNVYSPETTSGKSFLYFELSPYITRDSRRAMASLKLPRIWAYETVCLQFQYFLDGNDEDELEVRISGKISPYSRKQLWHHTGTKGQQWTWVLVRLPYTDFNLYIRARKVSALPVRLAVDDVTVGECRTLLSVSMPDYEPVPAVYRPIHVNSTQTGSRPVDKVKHAHHNETFRERWGEGKRQEECKCDCTAQCEQKLQEQRFCPTFAALSSGVTLSGKHVLILVTGVMLWSL